MAGVVALVLFVALLAQAVLAMPHRARARSSPAGAERSPGLLVPVSWIVAGCFAALVPVMLSLSDLDPAECAPLSDAEARAFVAAGVGCLAVAAGLSAWAAIRAGRGDRVQLLVIGEVVASAASLFVIAWLSGGTSC